jgi:hypothetical protein
VSKGIIGENFTFQVLFLDTDGTPLTVLTPIIKIYHWNEDGDQVTLLMPTPLPVAVPAETGRYAYTYPLPGSLTVRDVVYGLMEGSHPVSGDTLSTEVSVDLFTESEAAATDGLIARFVRGG